MINAETCALLDLKIIKMILSGFQLALVSLCECVRECVSERERGLRSVQCLHDSSWCRQSSSKPPRMIENIPKETKTLSLITISLKTLYHLALSLVFQCNKCNLESFVADCLTFRGREVPEQREQRTWAASACLGSCHVVCLGSRFREAACDYHTATILKNKSIYRDPRDN